ncbi:MAG: DASS family sodium-coupled anion symporter, partial [Gemmatimonadetes bacterium]|nr:DASS family sodium-coupled anion symporter [Gemmatimonadota bacterium]
LWVSNTATAAMMLPIGLALTELLRPADPEEPFLFATALMLGIAYSATIGGLGTLIGTPPNAVFAAAARELLGQEVGFAEWLAVGLPLVVILLPLSWVLLVFVFFPPGRLPPGAADLLRSQRQELGPPRRGEILTLIIFLLAVAGWLMREPKQLGAWRIPGLTDLAPGVDDSTIAIAAARLLFLLPVERRRSEFVLDWGTAQRLPWGVLLLFGGGLSLARAFEETGLTEAIAAGVGGLVGLPVWVVLGLTAAVFVYLSELASNTAIAALAMPVLAAAARGVGQEPLVFMAVGALASSTAFMLPVGTPPNAIAFGTGYIRMADMVRAGFWLNLISVALVTLAASLLIGRVLG